MRREYPCGPDPSQQPLSKEHLSAAGRGEVGEICGGHDGPGDTAGLGRKRRGKEEVRQWKDRREAVATSSKERGALGPTDASNGIGPRT